MPVKSSLEQDQGRALAFTVSLVTNKQALSNIGGDYNQISVITNTFYMLLLAHSRSVGYHETDVHENVLDE